ncbi:MAG: hypothetical protein AVDCRST_MAG96-2819 [uncultured Segetibacter sp.]|uniref:Uncharacterized protein n=1 Tax=uncultured Segetibacter sp. TaxID=481133 RepID=A0A6J4TCK6_9BACT|nr:MAG: hypothetical protein AVDCRST_MAG96-2819 [uncultured Segetibacter sp.]
MITGVVCGGEEGKNQDLHLYRFKGFSLSIAKYLCQLFINFWIFTNLAELVCKDFNKTDT